MHRAQGRTVDTAHALLDDTATRESLYVAMTRARQGNHLYLATPLADDSDDLTQEATPTAAADAMIRILERSATNASAHSHLDGRMPPVAHEGVNWDTAPSRSIDHRPHARTIGV